MQQPITFITGNKSKVAQLEKDLAYPIDYKNLELTEIQSLDGIEVATHKAKEAYSHIHSPVLVEDTSLVFNAWGKLPGPLIKWFLREIGNDGVCQLLSSFADKSAVCDVHFAFYDGKEVAVFSASMKGKIADAPRGNLGFGWDPIFIEDGATKTRAELSKEEYDHTTPRKTAVEKLHQYLMTHFPITQ